MSNYKESTICIHEGDRDLLIQGSVVTPIFQSSTYLSDSGTDDYHSIRYLRTSTTPNHELLHAKLSQLEKAEAALVTSSGMSAISSALFGVLKAGDHLLAQDCLYGGTMSLLLQDLPQFGIEVDFVSLDQPESWVSKLKPSTKLFYTESVTNPLMQVGDLRAVIAFKNKHGLISAIDNTIASSFNFKPMTLGFDLSLHSATKYLNGHSDITAGVILGAKPLISKIKARFDHLGGCLDPNSCFLLNRGLKTYALRMETHNSNGMYIAQRLAELPDVTKLYYPGLSDHPSHQRAKELFTGFSGMMSFELDGGKPRAERFISKLRLPLNAPSLGGVESLVTRPATTSHSGLSAKDRAAMGVTESLVRLSVGIEDKDDLMADLLQALESSKI